MATPKTAAATSAKTSKASKAKAVKAAEVKTVEQLQEELVALRSDYQEARRSHRMGELVNPHALTVYRKQIARTLTALAQTAQANQVGTKATVAATKEEN